MIKKAIGRPNTITNRTLVRIADDIQHNYTVSDACRHANISRDSFYRYLKDEPKFTQMIITAYENQNKVVMNFLRPY